jgi:ABC-type branched-subunit amino acid transport system substrate-binding protein
MANGNLRTLLLGSLAISCGTSATGEDLPDFLDLDRPVSLGAVLCVTGAVSAKASMLEQSAILLEEYVNGSTRAYPDLPPDEIPCRQQGNCGAWSGTDASGEVVRGPVRIILADYEQRADRAVLNARALVDEHQVPAIIGPCDAESMERIFEEVTATSTVLMSPVVNADSITHLDDRTADDRLNDLPGYVYRTILPSYVEVGLGANLISNLPEPQTSVVPLLRAEDETSDDCTTASPTYCSSRYGASYRCARPLSMSEPQKNYFTYSEDNCADQPEGYCDKLGTNSGCTTAPADASPRCSSGTCCGRYRLQKVCAKYVQPKAALVLYEDTQFGNSAKDFIDDLLALQDVSILASRAFDPKRVDLISSFVADAFADAAGAMSGAGLPADYDFADSVVFLFAGATAGTLILQEWQLQLGQLPSGSDRVFWLGTDNLRTTLLTNQVAYHSIRNLYVTNPYVLDPIRRSFFEELFQKRWGRTPDQYAGTTFDAGLLLVAANERAGLVRQRGGDLSGSTTSPDLPSNSGTDLKNSVPHASVGCYIRDPAQVIGGGTAGCSNPVSARPPAEFASAIADLHRGSEIKILGVSGTLTFSPAGDRLGLVDLWKIASTGPSLGFFRVRTLDPIYSGGPLLEY